MKFKIALALQLPLFEKEKWSILTFVWRFSTRLIELGAFNSHAVGISSEKLVWPLKGHSESVEKYDPDSVGVKS